MRRGTRTESGIQQDSPGDSHILFAAHCTCSRFSLLMDMRRSFALAATDCSYVL